MDSTKAPVTTPRPAAAARSAAQLTYTSFDTGTGPGGWQIKEVTGHLSQSERESLVKRIVTAFDLEPRLPRFPDQDQIDSRPRRLSYQVIGGVGAYWHTVDAGRDASGRPGNVFAHVALDRRPIAARADRPIVRWRSPDWLVPYGQAHVAAATLAGPELPRPNPDINVVSAVEFLLGRDIDRQGVFRVLLDAVAQAISGGPSVVLLTDGRENSAQWIAAVSFFLPLQVTQGFSWTTHDGPDYAEIDVSRGVHLIAMAHGAEPEPGRPAGAVVIDESEVPDLGDLGSVHRVARGQVPVGVLSTLAEGVLADEEIAIRVLARCEQISEEFADDTLTPLWPLAIAVEEDADLAEFHADALKVIADDAPDGVDRVPWAAQRVGKARMSHPLTADQLLTRFVEAHRNSRPVEAIGAQFLTAALADAQWIAWGPVESVPDARAVDLAALRPALDERIAELAARSGSAEPAEQMIEGLRLAEVIDRVGRRGSEFTRVTGELAAALDAGGLRDFFWAPPDRWPGNFGVHIIGPDVRARYLRPILAQYPVDYLRSIRFAGWSWIFEDAPAGSGDIAGQVIPVPANPTPADAYLYPFAAVQVLAAPETAQADRAVRREWATAAIEFTLSSDRYSDEDCRAVVAGIVGLECPDVEDLLDWSSREPARTGSALLRAPVLTGPADHRLFEQVIAGDRGHVREAGITDGTLAAAMLRRLCTEPDSVPLTRTELLAAVEICVAEGIVSERRCAPDLALAICTGYVVGQLAGEPWAPPSGPGTPSLGALTPDRRYVSPFLLHLIRRGIVDVDLLVAQSLLGRIDGKPPVRTLIDVPGLATWSDRIIETLAADGYPLPASVTALRDAVWPVLARGYAARAERFFAEYPAAARDWLKEFRVTAREGNPVRDGGQPPRSRKEPR